jgi:glutathione synthase/RimK-type ligase-like ATP-grasp enzyme
MACIFKAFPMASGPLHILIVYDTYELASSIGNLWDRIGTGIPAWLAAKSEVTWLASGRYRLKKMAAECTASALRDLGHAATLVNIDDLKITGRRLLHQGRPFDLSSFDGVWFRASMRMDLSRVYPRCTALYNQEIASFIEDHVFPVTPFARLVQLDGKIDTYYFFAAHGIPIPPTMVLFSYEKESPRLGQKINDFLDSVGNGPYVLKKDYGNGGHQTLHKHRMATGLTGTFISHDRAAIGLKARRWLDQASYYKQIYGIVLQGFIPSRERGERRIEVMVTPRQAEVFYGMARHGARVSPLLTPDEPVEDRFSTTIDRMTAQDHAFALHVGKTCGPGFYGVDVFGDEQPVLAEANPFSSVGFFGPRKCHHRGQSGFARMAAAIVETVSLKHLVL